MASGRVSPVEPLRLRLKVATRRSSAACDHTDLGQRTTAEASLRVPRTALTRLADLGDHGAAARDIPTEKRCMMIRQE